MCISQLLFNQHIFSIQLLVGPQLNSGPIKRLDLSWLEISVTFMLVTNNDSICYSPVSQSQKSNLHKRMIKTQLQTIVCNMTASRAGEVSYALMEQLEVEG